MTAYNGLFMLIKAGNGEEPEEYSTIGGLRTSVLTINQQPAVSNHLESGPWRRLLTGAGLRSMSISGSGMFTDSASEEHIRAHAFEGSVGNYQFIFANGDRAEGPFMVTAYTRSGAHDTEEMYSLSMESAGSIVFTPV